MENKKGFYDEIYENYKNLSLAEVEELFSRYNEKEKESFIRMLEKCCLKRDLKKEIVKEENQEKEKIEQNYKEYEEKLLSFIEKMVLMVAGYISFALTGFSMDKIRISGILGIPLIMVLGALFLKRVIRYKFYKNKYEKICKENYLENKIKGFDCDGLINICISILYIFGIFYYLGCIIGLPLGKFELVFMWGMIVFFVFEILLILFSLYKNKSFKLK